MQALIGISASILDLQKGGEYTSTLFNRKGESKVTAGN